MTDLPQPVLYEQQDGIAVITLNRPEKKNAINLAMAHLIQRYLQQAEPVSHRCSRPGWTSKPFSRANFRWSIRMALPAWRMRDSPR